MGKNSKKPSKYDADVIVIGSGAAGSIAANILAQSQKKVILIESNKVGGDCANYSCIPTRALLETAQTLRTIEQASKVGVSVSTPKVDLASAMHWQQKAISHTGITSESTAFSSDNIRVVKGHARFISPYIVTVGLQRFCSPKFIIATGSSPIVPDINGISDVSFVTYKSFTTQQKMPTSVAIIGGGSVGYEYAQIYKALGVSVHVFEQKSHLMARQDNEIGDIAETALSKQGVRVHTKSLVTSLKTTTKGTIIHYKEHGQDHALSVGAIFIACGHTPNTDVGLENAYVTYTSDGIKTDSKLRSSQKHIFVVGDVTGDSASASNAMRHGQIAAHNILHRKSVNVDHSAVPDVAFGLPEIATVGISERRIKLTGQPYQTSIAPIGIVGRSATTAYSDGFVKIIASHKGIILGASIVAPHASELITELTFAIQYRRRACDVSNTIHVFSSWSEAVRVAASKIYCI